MGTNPQLGWCKRCLLREIGDTELYQTVADYLDSLEPSLRAGSSVYEKRLEICRACEFLQNGMCRLCGCFVEVRAAKSASCCPSTPRKWQAE